MITRGEVAPPPPLGGKLEPFGTARGKAATQQVVTNTLNGSKSLAVAGSENGCDAGASHSIVRLPPISSGSGV